MHKYAANGGRLRDSLLLLDRTLVDKNRRVVALLNPNQCAVFVFLHSQLLSRSGRIEPTEFGLSVEFDDGGLYVLDASPGTGKTFVISAFGITCALRIAYVAYSTHLKDTMDIYLNLEALTTCSFLCKALRTSYMSVINMWNRKERTFYEMCHDMLQLVPTAMFANQVYILDEYTVLSPWCIAWLCWCAEYHQLQVVFVGDRYQHAAIAQSRYYLQSNYALLQRMNAHTMTLEKNMRQIDDNSFQQILARIRQCLNSSMMTKFTFAHVWLLYQLLPAAFTVTEYADEALFMSQYHRKIKARISTLTGGVKMPYVHKVDKTRWIAAILPENEQFVDYLYLKLGALYLYQHEIVRLQERTCQQVTVRRECDGRLLVLRRCVMTAQTAPHVRVYDWLRQSNRGGTVYQFPLRPFTTTYHAIQGLTLQMGLVDFDIDVQHLNSVYVGLSRLTKQSQIHGIFSTYRESIKATAHYNDEYYYFTPKFNAAAQYRTIQIPSVPKFNWRILRSRLPLTVSSEAISVDGPLGEFCAAVRGNVSASCSLSALELEQRYPSRQHQ